MVIGEKVVLSLRTKDPETAKTRFRLAAQALGQYFKALEKGPQTLTRTQRTALVGDIDREAVRDLETDDSFLAAIEATTTEFDANVAHHLGAAPADETLYGIPARPGDEKTAELLAAIDLHDPKALAAWALKYETDPTRRAVALEQLYGLLVDGAIARNQILVDETSRGKTLEVMDQAADAFGEMATRRLTSLDFSAPFGAGLPAWNAPTPATPGPVAAPRGVLTMEKLFAK